MNHLGPYLRRCPCGRKTTHAYARAHDGKCKLCAEGIDTRPKRVTENGDTYHDWVASGAMAAGVSYSDC